jgi:TonB family protein
MKQRVPKFPLLRRPGDAMAIARFRITERQVLLLIMAGSILAYVGAILVVTFRQKGKQPDLTRPARVRWMPPQTGKGPMDIRYVIADLLDPSLMSLPSVHGFSRLTWDSQPTATYHPPEPPVVLAFLDAGTPPAMQPLLSEPTLDDTVRASVEKLTVEPEVPVESPPIEPQTAVNRTVIELTTGLEQRTLAERPDLPTVVSEAPLRPTRLRVAVSTDGTVRYAMLERSCGNESVDHQALDIARQLRFEPQGGTGVMGLTWGVARFVWATTAPAADEAHN